MNIRKLISICLCTAIISAVFTGCAPEAEIQDSLNSGDSVIQTSEKSVDSTEVSAGSEMSVSTVYSQTTASSSTKSDVSSPAAQSTSATQSSFEESSLPRSESTTSSNAHQHNYSEKVVAPTCTETGYTIHICSCGEQYTDNAVSALGHEWGNWTIVQEATSVSNGVRQRVCSRCGQTQSESIAKVDEMREYALRVVDLVNAERAKQGLSPLTVKSELMDYAQLRSTEIVDNFDHKRPDGSSPLNYVMSLDGIHRAGENIAGGYSTPEKVMEGWMNSTGHRQNILNSSYTMIGVGCYKSNGMLYWTQIFAG